MPRARQRFVSFDTFPYAYMTPPEIAGAVKCDARTILRMIDNGSLHGYRVGRNWRVLVAEVRRAFPVEHTSRYIA